MGWLAGLWRCLVGTLEECQMENPETIRRVKHLVKRAFALGIMTGFLLVALLFRALW